MLQKPIIPRDILKRRNNHDTKVDTKDKWSYLRGSDKKSPVEFILLIVNYTSIV